MLKVAKLTAQFTFSELYSMTRPQNSVLAWRRVRSHLYTPAHVQIHLGEQKIVHTDRFHVYRAARVNEVILFIKGKHDSLSRLFFLLAIIPPGFASSFFSNI